MGKITRGQQLTRRAWIAGGVAVAMTPVLTACGGGGESDFAADKAMAMATEPGTADLPTLNLDTTDVQSGLTASYLYGTETRQVLDLYRAPSATVATPGPIYIWAHPNDTTYRKNLPYPAMRQRLLNAGVSIISWESHTRLISNKTTVPGAVPTENEVIADSYLMLNWVRKYGRSLGLDPDRIILGGASRGTYASWKIGHDPAHAWFIKGMFMKQALPGSVGSPIDQSTMQGPQTVPYDIGGQPPSYWVTATSPITKFVHLSVDADRFHCEYNSTPVMQAYVAKEIGSKTSRVTNVATLAAMDDLYLLDFVAASLNSVAPPPPPAINFADDFNNGFNAANYTKSGSWDVAAGALRQTVNSSYGYCATGEGSWANYTVTATLMSLNAFSATDNAQVSRIVARFIDGNNFYEAFISKGGTLVIQSKKAGLLKTIQSVQVTGIDVANWNTLALTCNGNALTVSLNGVAQVTVSDADHSAGKAGVRSFACETRVDSLTIVGV